MEEEHEQHNQEFENTNENDLNSTNIDLIM